MLDRRVRYLQLAFNDDVGTALRIVPTLPQSERIILEAGTPYIKREGLRGIKVLRGAWPHLIVADLKTSDGGAQEVAMVQDAGAHAATVLGSSPAETLNSFIAECAAREIDSMIDLIGVLDPLTVMRKLRQPPSAVILHRGRDEESSRAKTIEYKHVSRIRSKYDVSISAAGGVDLREARTAIFNGANIVVVNIVAPGAPWTGISATENVGAMAQKFLDTIA